MAIDEQSGAEAEALSRANCPPGHSDGDPPCEQIDDDATVVTAFPTAGTPQVVAFEYPYDWRTSTTGQFEEWAQANVTRDDFDAIDQGRAALFLFYPFDFNPVYTNELCAIRNAEWFQL